MHAARRLRSWLIFDVRRKSRGDENTMMREEGESPARVALPQKSAEPLLCTGRQMRVMKRSIRGNLSSARSAAIARGASSERRACKQHSELVRHANALKENFAMRGLHPRRRASMAFERSGGYISLSVFAPRGKRPNKALEPTPGSVTPRAGARVAPAPVVAHL